jgi:hypothetical protein
MLAIFKNILKGYFTYKKAEKHCCRERVAETN